MPDRDWLVLTALISPVAGVVLQRACVGRTGPRWGDGLAWAGVMIAAAASAVLAFTADSAVQTESAWTWFSFATASPRHVVWQLNSEDPLALWVVMVAAIGTPGRRSRTGSSSDAAWTAWLVTATGGLVFASGGVSSLVAWGLFAILPLLGTVTDIDDTALLRCMGRAGLWGIGLLVSALILALISGMDWPDRSLESHPIPPYVGGLVLLGILGRSGLFPASGWMAGVSVWRGARGGLLLVTLMVSGVILLHKLGRGLNTDVARDLAVGLGTLSAAAGAFVAWGQQGLACRVASLVAAQLALLVVGLGSGMPNWHFVLGLCGTGLAAALLWEDSLPSTSSLWSRGLATLSLVGVLPFTGGWIFFECLHATLQVVSTGAGTMESGRPRWEIPLGIGIAQFLSAASAAPLLRLSRSGSRSQVQTEWGLVVMLAAVSMSLGGLAVSTSTAAGLRFLGLGMGLSLLGGLAGWGWDRHFLTGRSPAGWVEPLERLSENWLHVDSVADQATRLPRGLIRSAATASPARLEKMWESLFLWISRGIHDVVESLQHARGGFVVGTFLLGTMVFLLALLWVT